MANLIGLTVARNSCESEIRKRGIQSRQNKLVIYASSETHSSIQKSVEMLGLGSENLRLIPVNKDFQMDLATLEAAIKTDRGKGLKAFCVVGNAGTVNTGAIDDLQAISEIAKREKIWFHVDGAFGAWGYITQNLQQALRGMENADSLSFDLHKWLYVPYDAGCTLVRSEKAHREAFSLTPAYLSRGDRGINQGTVWFSDYTIELSRSFRALKVWMSLKEHGLNKYRQMIQKNIDQAKFLADLVTKSQDLELLAPVPMNIVCFRYKDSKLKAKELNDLNAEILVRLQESGVAAPSSTVIHGHFAIRVAISNHRSLTEDFRILVREVLRIGNELSKG